MAFGVSMYYFLLAVGAGARTGEPTTQEHKSMADVAKLLNNPMADIRALNFQFHRDYPQGEATDRTREQDVMNFPPVLPIHLIKEWNLITRPVLPCLFSSLILSWERAGTTIPASAISPWCRSCRRTNRPAASYGERDRTTFFRRPPMTSWGRASTR